MLEMKAALTLVLCVVLSEVDVISSYVNVNCPQVGLNQRIHPCTREYHPVCGTNRKTYSNSCGYCAEKWTHAKNRQAFNVYVDREGSCNTNNPTAETPNVAQTFYQNVINRYFPASSSPTSYQFLGNRQNGRFSNQLWQWLNRRQSPFRQQQPYRSNDFSRGAGGRRGNCGPFGPRCSRYGHVCGSNRRTYASECDLCSAARRSRITIQIINDGYCQ